MNKKYKYLIACVCSLTMIGGVFGQANGFGFKTGPSLGFQKWGGTSRQPLTKFSVDIFADSEGSGDTRNTIYGQLGYHTRGSAFRYSRFIDLNGNVSKGGSFSMQFHNIVLELGMKRFIKTPTKLQAFYALGLRGEYTAKTKFEIQESYRDFVRKYNYGISLRLGAESRVSKVVAMGFEFNIAQDISRQIWVPAGTKWYDYYTGSYTIGAEQSIRNFSLELSVYFRFLQIIVYEE
ncbi:MAG TPA: hypothetical protein PKD32_05785 [Saprospiraceae bacterium]|jgi:hypothetical protein|nr:hypothetical protein [Saprospiraceae bacterium]HMS29340.1 hypothetical protein [Saprospiraceae bacterium]